MISVWFASVCWIWLGLLCGISFLEAPVKFRARGLTLPVALEVGREVFGASQRVQLALEALALMLAFLGDAPHVALAGLAALGLCLAIQELVLRPRLGARADRVRDGEPVGPSRLHWAYIGVDATKVLLLAALASTAMTRR